MSKYDPVGRYLAAADRQELRLSFAQVEKILGFSLPASARRYAAWWSNSGGSHVQAAAWLGAGFETADVDVTAGTLTFVPVTTSIGFGEMKQAPFQLDDPAQASKKRHPVFGCMKGTLTLLPGVDLTEPADPDWGKVYDPSFEVKLYEP
jgi:hypothetical protein